MPIEFRCVNCQKLLRVVDEAVGKKARCPDCGTIQEARPSIEAVLDSPSPLESATTSSFGSTPIPPTPPDRSSTSNPFNDRAPLDSPFGPSAINPYQSPLASSARAPFTRAAALAKVEGPATGLLVVAILVIVTQIIAVAVIAFSGVWGGARFEEVIPNVIGMVFGLGISVSIAIGAMKMRRLESYSLAMMAAVLAILPCSGCCVLSMPLGIWALVVLLDAQVKESFG